MATDPGFTKGQTPTAAQWNSYFAAKADQASGTLDSPTITGATTAFSAAFSGAVTATAAGTGLAVTNNATVGGTLGVTGASSFGNLLTINVGAAAPAISTGGLGTFGWLAGTANNGTVTYTTGMDAGPGISAIYGNGSLAGTGGTGKSPVMFEFSIPSDTLNSLATPNGAFGFALAHNFGGAGFAGSHTAMLIQMTQTGAIANGGGSFYGGLNVWMTGAAAVSGTPAAMIAFNPQVNMTAAATGYSLIELMEGGVGSLAPIGSRAGVTIFSTGSFQGTNGDYGLGLVGSASATARFNFGVAYGKYDDNWPLNSSSTMVGTIPQTTGGVLVKKQVAARGIDFSKVSFGTAAFWSPGLKIEGDGTSHFGAVNITPNATGGTIDTEGYQGNTPTVSAGGLGYTVNDNLYDGLGGIYVVDTVNGLGTILTGHYDKAPYSFGGAGPATSAMIGGSGNQAAVIGTTWTKGTILYLQTAGGQVIAGGFLSATGIVNSNVGYTVNNVAVVQARNTGWTAMTGTTNKNTVYDTSTVTTAQIAGRVMAIQQALTAHGLIGP